jgi:hypothetical protein
MCHCRLHHTRASLLCFDRWSLGSPCLMPPLQSAAVAEPPASARTRACVITHPQTLADRGHPSRVVELLCLYCRVALHAYRLLPVSFLPRAAQPSTCMHPGASKRTRESARPHWHGHPSDTVVVHAALNSGVDTAVANTQTELHLSPGRGETDGVCLVCCVVGGGGPRLLRRR